MKQFLNTYKGLNQDAAYDTITNQQYIDAKDVRITTTSGESTGAITNIEGNSRSFSVDQAGATGTKEIIGVCTIRNVIVLFCADNTDTNGWIYFLTYDEKTREITSTGGAPVLIYFNAALNFSKDNPIEAVGRFENQFTQRIYFTDYNNPLRTLNIASVINGGPALTIDIGLVDIFPEVTYTIPLLVTTGGSGNLLVGEYQFAYRLTTFDGQETLISPPGDLIHIVSKEDSYSRTAEYMGDPKGTNSSKSITVEVNTTNYAGKFEFIELIALFYEDFNGVPTISSIEKKQIGATTSSIEFEYTGFESEITTITTTEFATKVYPFSTVKTLVPKDNSLVVANVKETAFNVQDRLSELGETFDPQTVRYLQSTTTLPAAGDDRKFNKEYNRDAHWDGNWHTSQQYKYQRNSTVLGGQSDSATPNISYKFTLHKYEVDADSQPGFANLSNTSPNPDVNLFENTGLTYKSNSFVSFASPYLSGLTRGYKRGETYRFGIVFYTKKGESSFVEYIGDIKFPDISEEDATAGAYTGGINYFVVATEFVNVTFAYSLGIEFTLDFSTCPNFKDEISCFQIVRVERQNKDKRRVCSGILKTYHRPDFGPTGSENYNFRDPNDGTDILHQFYTTKQGPNTGVAPFDAINGAFVSLNNNRKLDLGGGWDIYGDYISFYSPEISYNFNGPFNDGLNSDDAALLITGAYSNFVNDLNGTTNFTSSTPLTLVTTGNYFRSFVRNDGVGTDTGPATLTNFTFLRDTQRKLRLTHPIDKVNVLGLYDGGVTRPTLGRGVEYIKKFINKEKASYNSDINTTVDKDRTFGPFTNASLSPTAGFYMRNWLVDVITTEAVHQPDGNNANSYISQGNTCLIGNIGKYISPPLAATSLPYISTGESFSTVQGTSALLGTAFHYVKPLAGIGQDEFSSTPLIDYVIPRSEVYGGSSDSALSLNIFVPCSAPIVPTASPTSVFQVFRGDTFISMYQQQWGQCAQSTDYYDVYGSQNNIYRNANVETINFPVETSINVALAYGNTLKTGVKYFFGPDTDASFRLEEDNLSAAGGGSPYAKVLDMYKDAYNTIYSIDQTKSGLAYVTPPVGVEAAKENDIRAYLSNAKINGESIDSWSKFLVNNYYDVEAIHGPINKIINWRDEVYFFQDTGIGAYSINPRAVTTTTDGIPTELGSGQGFAHHQYVSTENGSIHQWAVQATDTGIYYFDATHKKIFRIAKGNQPLSEMTGMHSWLSRMNGDVLLRKENGGDNPINSKGVNIVRDMVNDEILFSFHGRFTLRLVDDRVFTYYPGEYVYYIAGPDTFYFQVNTQFTTTTNLLTNIALIVTNCSPVTDEEAIKELQENKATLVFDEAAQQFSSFYSAVPPIYIENGNILMSPNPDERETIFTHNKGNYGEFYGTVTEAYIKLVINPDADINKILRFIEFASTVRTKDKTIDRAKTITAFRVETEYQDTEKTIFSINNIKRRFDKWRVKLPRDQKSTSRRGRLRSTHFILTLYYDNTYNKELILNRLMSHYDIQVY